MKIGMVCRFPPEPDGIGGTYQHLVSALRKKKHTVITIGTKNSHSDYRINLRSALLRSTIAKIIKKEQLDIVHFHHIAPFYSREMLNANFLAALRQSVPTVVTLHEVHISSQGLRNKVLSWIERQATRLADGTIVHTPSQQHFLYKKFGSKVTCIFYGVETKKVSRTRAGKNILFFGILASHKGVENLIAAMHKLPGHRLRIYGGLPPPLDDSYKKKLEGLIDKKNTELIVRTWIPPHERDKAFRWADALVLPYLQAPYQSAVVTDAASYRLPMVVTKAGAVWELPAHFDAGPIIEPGSVKAIVAGIGKVTKNYKRYLKGIDRYRAEANWYTTADKYIEFYKKIIALRTR